MYTSAGAGIFKITTVVYSDSKNCGLSVAEEDRPDASSEFLWKKVAFEGRIRSVLLAFLKWDSLDDVCTLRMRPPEDAAI